MLFPEILITRISHFLKLCLSILVLVKVRQSTGNKLWSNRHTHVISFIAKVRNANNNKGQTGTLNEEGGQGVADRGTCTPS